MSTTDPLLRADGIERAYGGLKAVDVDHFEVAAGTIVALIGPNGAGKTTLFNVLTGFERCDAGSWVFDGQNLSDKAAYQIARSGMVRTFQAARVFPRLSVADNVRLGAQNQKGERLFASLVPKLWAEQDRDLGQRARELVEWVGLGAKADDLAGTLSGGQRKLLDLARATMAEPKLLMLDEPMAGVNPALKQSLLDHIMALREEGTTVLFVEHDINMVRHIADWVTVMAEGKIVAEGQPKSVMNDPAVIDAYLGAHANVDLGDDSVLEDLKEA